MLVLQLHAEHCVWQRLDDRGHHFDGVLLGIAGVAFLFFIAKLLRHSLLCCSCTGRAKARPLHWDALKRTLQRHDTYQDGPVTSFGRVRIQGPIAVTATVCSKCAERLPSAVCASHSSRMTTSGPPSFTIGSTAITIPSCNRAPRSRSTSLCT